MSKAERLRKDLLQASKALQTVTSTLEKLETDLSENQAALSKAKESEIKISSLKTQIQNLQHEREVIQKSREHDRSCYADMNKILVDEYNRQLDRTTKQKEESEREWAFRLEEQDKKWKEQIAKESKANQRVKNGEIQRQSEMEDQLQRLKTVNRALEERHSKELGIRDQKVAQLKKEVENLKHDQNRHETILKGKDTEIGVFKDRVATIEAFRPEEPREEVFKIIVQIQKWIGDFCNKCVDTMDYLPGWNSFPAGLRFNHLPRYFSDSAAGHHVLIAAVQHSICALVMKDVFVPLGTCASDEILHIAELLHRSDRSQESLWRLITAKAILADRTLMDSRRDKLKALAKSLLATYKPLFGDQVSPDLENLATQLLVDINTEWLNLMRFQERIHCLNEVSSQYFDSDSEEENYSVPGGFTLPDSTSAVLCLFPAFFRDSKSDTTAPPTLFRKGTAMFRDSPPLLVALNEEKEISSPRTPHKKRTSS